MTYFFWTKYPFVQLGFAFISGNALAYGFVDLPDFLLTTFYYYFLLGSGLAIAAIALLIVVWQYKKRIKTNGILLFLLFMYLGCIRFLTYDERYRPNYAIDHQAVSAFVGKVTTEPEHKNKGQHFLLCLQQVQYDKQWIPYRATIKVTLADTSSKINFNEVVLIKGTLEKPLKMETPYDFDYARFLAYQNIHYTCYSKTKPLVLTQASSFNFSFKPYAVQARQKLEQLLTPHLKDPRAYALATGLLIGKRSDLEENDKQLFTTSGTIHVLAVSGMHVVLIYQGLCFIALLFRVRQQGVVFNLILLSLIWFYIFITGLQASASRAAIMITLILISKLVQRDQQHTNSFFATACIMLAYNPYYIADVGFVLSFLAVAGIVMSSSLSLQNNTNKIWTYLFNAALLSTAAQAATFPYSIYLFHQFPVYFLLANLIVVPLTTLMLFLAIGLLLGGCIPYLSDLLVGLIEALTHFLFFILDLITHLPWPTISHLSLSALEMIVLYAAMLLTILCVVQRQVKWLWAITLSLTTLSGSLHYRMIHQFHHPAFFISGKNAHRQYIVSSGHQAWIFQHQINAPLNRAIELFITEHFIKSYEAVALIPKHSFILQQGQKKWGVVRKKTDKNSLTRSFFEKCDALILDYPIKYSYLDSSNTIEFRTKSFLLLGKKSFYSTTSTYELDTD
jgi:competence protein ComEC